MAVNPQLGSLLQLRLKHLLLATKLQNNGLDDNSSDSRYNSYTNITVTSKCQKSTSTVPEISFNTFKNFHPFLKFQSILHVHHTTILLPNNKKKRSKAHLCKTQRPHENNINYEAGTMQVSQNIIQTFIT